MGSTKYSILNGVSIASDINGILTINSPEIDRNLDQPQVRIDKKLNYNDKVCLEVVQNSRSGTYPVLLGSILDPIYNRYNTLSAQRDLGILFNHYYNNITKKTYYNNKQMGSDPSIGTVIGWCIDNNINCAYRYHDGVLNVTYDISGYSDLVNNIYCQYYQIVIYDYVCSGNLSINFGEKGLKYSYPGFTSVYDAKEYDSELDKLKIKTY